MSGFLAEGAPPVRVAHGAAVVAHVQAMVLQALLAVPAQTAGPARADGDALGGREWRVGPGLGDDAGDLVAQHHRLLDVHGAEAAGLVAVQVGAAARAVQAATSMWLWPTPTLRDVGEGGTGHQDGRTHRGCLQDVEGGYLMKQAAPVCEEEIDLAPCAMSMPPRPRPAHFARIAHPPRPALPSHSPRTPPMTLLSCSRRPSRRRPLALAMAALLGLAALDAASQPATGPGSDAASASTAAPGPGSASGYAPRRGQAGKDVMWIATPDAAVDRMLRMAEVRPADRVVDLGSGDGKIAIAAGRDFAARATGLEFNPELVALSTSRAREAGVSGRVEFRRADIFATDFGDATVVTMYLLPELNLRLRPILFRMAPGTRVVSHSFAMGDWRPDETAAIGNAMLHLWRVPANASGVWRVRTPSSAPAAVAGTAVTATVAAPAPVEFRFTQRFQQVEGQASFGPLTASAVRPVLAGDALGFAVRDANGALLQVRARIAGDRMTGTLKPDGGAALAFDAERVGAAQPIEGVEATPAERDAAARALN